MNNVRIGESTMSCGVPVTSLKIVKTLGGDGESAIWFEMMTPNGLVQCCDWLEVADGEIVSITSFYDATNLR